MIFVIPVRHTFQSYSHMFRHRQYKHIWSCFSQYCGRFHRGNLLVFCKALLLASEFPTFYERFFMVCMNSSSSGSMKKIPRNCPALSSFGFSIAYFCFALLFDASDMCFHISDHTLSGLEVVCFFASLTRTMYVRQVACRSTKCVRNQETCQQPCVMS